jgi:hypothetical protein
MPQIIQTPQKKKKKEQHWTEFERETFYLPKARSDTNGTYGAVIEFADGNESVIVGVESRDAALIIAYNLGGTLAGMGAWGERYIRTGEFGRTSE